MSRIDAFVAIDPGTIESGISQFVDGLPRMGENSNVVATNDSVLRCILSGSVCGPVVIEDFRPSGNRIGMDSIETIVWIGRFFQAALDHGNVAVRIPRRDVKRFLCGNIGVNDAGVWMAVVDEFGGKIKAIGDKKNPGPLYGIKSHVRQAVALGVTYMEQQRTAAGGGGSDGKA